MNQHLAAISKKGLPDGFVYADEAVPYCLVDAKYAGDDNFLGRPVAGYHRPFVVLSLRAAQGLQKVAEEMFQKGYRLKLFDAYRPQRAVDDFVAWGKDVEDIKRKHIHYPNEDKSAMFEKGYIARRSGHSRGSAVDLTLVDKDTLEELDMGTIFDLMDSRSHHGAAGITKAQEDNRKFLCDVMCSNGFRSYTKEWWHYIVDPEPYPDTYFDFPIE
jgi:D-alanyl-D-alanine dipeptidase